MVFHTVFHRYIRKTSVNGVRKKHGRYKSTWVFLFVILNDSDVWVCRFHVRIKIKPLIPLIHSDTTLYYLFCYLEIKDGNTTICKIIVEENNFITVD